MSKSILKLLLDQTRTRTPFCNSNHVKVIKSDYFLLDRSIELIFYFWY